jgi:beta-lactamase regulating signal transducer with metallopeptidase domain
VFDLLVQAILSNLLVSTLLAGLAWIAQRRLRSPSLVNLLWLIVLVKLVTPPLFSIPAIEISRIATASIEPARGSGVELPDVSMLADWRVGSVSALGPDSNQHATASGSIVSLRSDWVNGALFAWVSVSGLLFLVSTVRILRFNRLLKANGRPAPKSVSEIANDVAGRFGLRRVPRIFLSRARITPFVWWLGGQPRITISEQAVDALCRHDLRLVIAHEMAHIKRRDHWVRWLEWFAVNLVWWNPVMWWARSQLRISEEIACDGLVIESIESERPRYAHALLNMADLMTSPAVRPPAVVSAISSGGDLERRLMMILAEKTWHAPAALRLAIAVSAICVLPLGLVHAQDLEAVERRLGDAVGAGELTLDQAKSMMDALRKTADSGGGKTGRAHEGAAAKDKHTAVERKLKIAVERGAMSTDEARQALHALEQKLHANGGTKINAPVGDAKMPPLEALKQLGAMRGKTSGPTNYFFMVDRAADAAALKTELEAIERKIKAAVDDGRLSAPEAKQKLGAVREKLCGPNHFFFMTDTERDPAALKTDAEAIVRKIDDGKLSAPEAKQKPGAIRGEWSGTNKFFFLEDTKRDPAALKTDVEGIERRIKAAVDDGKLSAPEAKQKLGAIREKMSGSTNFYYLEERNPAALQTEFEAIKRKVKAAVDHGKLSDAEAKRMLDAIHQEQFGPSDEKAKGGAK